MSSGVFTQAKRLTFAAAFALTGLGAPVLVAPAMAAPTVDGLVRMIVNAAETAHAARTSVPGAVSGAIEMSGASPEMISDAVVRLLSQCPTGELAKSLAERNRVALPAHCTPEAQVALRGARSVALASLGSAPTASTGPVSNLPIPPARSSGGSSDYRPGI